MHVGRSYRLIDFALWSRRSVIYMTIVSVAAVAAYIWLGFSVPWPIVLVVGTTVSLVAGFKNGQVLQRSSEALQAFAQIAATSRTLASLCCDFLEAEVARSLVRRHLGWLTALRYSLRRPMPWESMSRPANREFRRRRYKIDEDQRPLADALAPLLGDDAETVLAAERPVLALLHLQAREINGLLKSEAVPGNIYGELLKVVRDCHDQQARCDRIKDNPYPRQYAIVSTMFAALFCTLLPFGVVPIFAGLADPGAPVGPAIWLSVPFSVLLGWLYMSLDQVSEATSNPFEGNANDVPISQISRDLEIELRGWMGETDLPPRIKPVHDIVT